MSVASQEPFTYGDLASFPDDGLRRELVDGQLLVSPSLRLSHQRAAARLFSRLERAAPSEVEVFFAPLDVVFSASTVLVPDVLVMRREDAAEELITRPPLLVVEVFSPSTRRTDLTLKRATYEAHGVQSYLLVDPAVPSLTVLELEDGRYVERAVVQGEESWTAERPFPVSVTPTDLVRV